MSVESNANRDEKKSICVVTTHPIQYMAPWYRELTDRDDVSLHVVFLRHLSHQSQGVGFGVPFVWDVPLLAGYSNESLDLDNGVRDLFKGFFALTRILKYRRPDVVLVTGWNEALLVVAQLVARLCRIKLLVRGESNDLRKRSAFVRLTHRALLALAHGFLTIGTANRRFYASNGVHPERLFDGAYFVETERMLRMREAHLTKRATLRAERGFGEEDVVLLFCGKHVAFKRPQLLIEAAALLRGSGLPVKVSFAGSGELTQSLRMCANALSVPVHFEGFLNQTELWRAYLSADIFVLPSTNGETWGLVTNEAMLFELPVLVSNEVGSRYDLVVDGETGFGFDATPEALAAVAKPLAADPELRRRLSVAGAMRVREKYSSHNATDGLIQALRAVI